MVGAARVAKFLGYGITYRRNDGAYFAKIWTSDAYPRPYGSGSDHEDECLMTRNAKRGNEYHRTDSIGNATIHHDLSAELLKEIVES